MTDTDPDMMRRQQNMDTRQTIEGEGRQGPADLDPQDGRDRLEARSGRAAGPGHQDDVLAQNTRGVPGSQKGAINATRRMGGLVRKGRSLLGA